MDWMEEESYEAWRRSNTPLMQEFETLLTIAFRRTGGKEESVVVAEECLARNASSR